MRPCLIGLRRRGQRPDKTEALMKKSDDLIGLQYVVFDPTGIRHSYVTGFIKRAVGPRSKANFATIRNEK